MRRAAACILGLLAFAGAGAAATRADGARFLAIRLSAYEVDAADRVAEIDAAMAEPEPHNDEVEHIWKLIVAAQRGDTAARAELERRTREAKAEFETATPRDVAPVVRDRDRRIWDATRGLEPQIAIECVAAEGATVEVPVWDAKAELSVTRIFRVEQIGGAKALIEISKDLGPGTGGPISMGAAGVAYPYPLGAPRAIQTAGFHGHVQSWAVEFLELGVAPHAPRGDACSVRYAAGTAPPNGARPAAIAPSEPLER